MDLEFFKSSAAASCDKILTEVGSFISFSCISSFDIFSFFRQNFVNRADDNEFKSENRPEFYLLRDDNEFKSEKRSEFYLLSRSLNHKMFKALIKK